MTTDPFLLNAIAGAGEHLGGVIKMLVDGIAFPVEGNGKKYWVFSHEGDELGELTTAEVNFATHYMKRLGRVTGVHYLYKGRRTNPGITFAWEGSWDDLHLTLVPCETTVYHINEATT